MDVRKFWITTANADKVIDLTDVNTFAHHPSGLGITIESDAVFSDGSLSITNERAQYSDITLGLTIGSKSTPYSTYAILVAALSEGGLTLHYSLPAEESGTQKTYSRAVRFKSISKNELNEFGVLEESLTLIPTTPWYVWYTVGVNNYNQMIQSTLSMDGAKIFDYVFNPVYYYPYVNDELAELIATGDNIVSQIPIDNIDSIYMGISQTSPLRIIFTNKSTEPIKALEFNLRDEHLNVISKMVINIDDAVDYIQPNDIIMIDSDYDNLQCGTFTIVDAAYVKASSLERYISSISNGYIRVPKGSYILTIDKTFVDPEYSNSDFPADSFNLAEMIIQFRTDRVIV